MNSANKNDGYYSIKRAYSELQYSYGAKEKTVAGLKLVGKGLFNTARYALKEGPAIIERQVQKEKAKQR